MEKQEIGIDFGYIVRLHEQGFQPDPLQDYKIEAPIHNREQNKLELTILKGRKDAHERRMKEQIWYIENYAHRWSQEHKNKMVEQMIEARTKRIEEIKGEINNRMLG